MIARIYRPAKTAMQSGRANTQRWLLEYEPEGARRADPLMGWTGGGHTRGQLRLEFASRDEAITYADRHGIAYRVAGEHAPKRRIKAYADNFR